MFNPPQKKKKKRYHPPNRMCENCGLTFRAWSGIYCPGCRRDMPPMASRPFSREARLADKLAALQRQEPPKWDGDNAA
jgi:hypothetical protein